MMRLLMIRLTEAGYAVCAAIHDGFLIECNADEADALLKAVRAVMDQCAQDLIGVSIPVKSKIFRWPESYREDDDDVTALFETIMRRVDEASTVKKNVA
jgi:hypothetical protein